MLGIVIANWNGEKLIDKCLKSLENQTFKDFKVYIIDNNSKDNSKEVIRKCTIRIKIRHEKDSVDNLGKLRSYYVGELFIDDKEYSIKGITALNDELEYIKDEEGNKRISFESDDRSGIVYVLDLYEGFNDEVFHIGLQDRRFNPTVNEEIIATVKDNIPESEGVQNNSENK